MSNMKLLVVLCLATVALARPQSEKDAQTIEYVNEHREDNSYDFTLETSNGIFREESGLSYPGAEPESGSYTQSGSFEFTHPDGTISYISFLADENGYQPDGEGIPKTTGRVNIQDI